MIEPNDRRSREGRADWAARVRAGLFDGLVNGMVGAALAGERLRRALDRRSSSRRFAGTPCSRLPRPEVRAGGDAERRVP